MATIRYGGGIVDARGSAGGTTFSRNASGGYSRARVAGTNPATNPQGLIRSLFGAAAAAWRSLTEAQRMAWIAAATTGQGLYIDRLGNAAHYSGQQLYMKLRQVQESYVYGGGGNGTGSGGDPPPVSAPPDVQTGNVILTTTALDVLSALTVTIDKAPATNSLLVYASPPVSAGIMRPSSTSYKLLIALDDVVEESSVSLAAAYTAVYGAGLAVGEKIWLRFAPVSTDSWEVGPSVHTAAVATLAV